MNLLSFFGFNPNVLFYHSVLNIIVDEENHYRYQSVRQFIMSKDR